MVMKIDPMKCEKNVVKNRQKDHLQDMQNEIKNIFNVLMSDSENFSAEKAFELLYQYIKAHQRILYSTISNIIYDCNRDSQDKEMFGVILSNIETLFIYSENGDNVFHETQNEEEKKAVFDTQKAIGKIWDHVNLAHQQYSVFWQSEEEYDKKFEARIQRFQGKITNEMNGQLLSMVGIFTALAFLLFGSISSLESIFSEIVEVSLLKLMISGCVWGLGMLNLIFVFLFCVGKMTKLNFKSTERKEASFFQRYPVVCWTDFILLVLLAVCLWLYYIRKNNADTWFSYVICKQPMLMCIIGFAMIAIIVYGVARWLIEKTKPLDGNEDTY